MNHLSKWQFNAAFIVMLSLFTFYAVAPYFQLEGTPNSLVVTGFGIILGYFFSKRDKLTSSDDESKETDVESTKTVQNEDQMGT